MNTSTETAEAISSETASMYTDINIMSIYETDYVIQDQKNRRLVDALSYGCYAGNQGKDEFTHVVSEPDNVNFFPVRFLERDLNFTVTGNFRFEMDCAPWNESSEKIQVGPEPPENTDLIVRSIPVPLPEGNSTNARLYRWYR